MRDPDHPLSTDTAMPDAASVPSAGFLEPASVQVTRNAGGGIIVRVDERPSTVGSMRLAFPLSPTERMIAFFDADDQYVGTLRDYHDLDTESRNAVEDELGQQYFRPSITKINSVRKRYGMIEIELSTDAGDRLLRLRSPRDDIRELSPGRFMLTDVTGNRYEIPCLAVLGESSRKLWHNLV